MPLNADGSFLAVNVEGTAYSGKALLDRLNALVQAACVADDDQDNAYDVDYMWYLWCGPDSPLFDKAKMATFERYLIADKSTHEEKKEITTC